MRTLKILAFLSLWGAFFMFLLGVTYPKDGISIGLHTAILAAVSAAWSAILVVKVGPKIASFIK